MKIKLSYVVRDTDRHGNVRLYFRRDGRKLRLRGPEGSPAFFEDYNKAVAGLLVARTSKNAVPVKSRPVTMRDLITAYYESAGFKTLGARTRYVRRGILERFCLNKGDGDKPFADLQVSHLRRRIDAMADRPEAANGLLKALRQVFTFAVRYELHDRNVAEHIEMLASKGEGIPAWSPGDVEAFEQVHPIGSMARLALALAFYTGQRKSDLIVMGPHQVIHRDGVAEIMLTQKKNRERKPVTLAIPLHPELQSILDATTIGSTSFLITEFGRPFSEGGFGNRFRKWCDEAGLKGLSVHGLRKAAAANLAEAGCTEQEIMAITGHRSSKEVIRYTRSADQKVRAANAIQKTINQAKENQQ